MFDLVSLAPTGVVIAGLDVNTTAIAGAPVTVEVYVVTAGGSYLGNEANPASWTLIGSAAVISAGPGIPTAVPLELGVTIPSGSTQGFYVTHSDGNVLGYTNGTVEGASFASDGNIDFLEGKGVVYPFGATFAPRVWNGTIHYVTGAALTPSFEVNTPAGSLTFQGRSGGVCQALVINQIALSCGIPATGSVELSTANNPGALFEVVLSNAPLVPGGVNVAGEILNVSLISTLSFVNGGAAPAFLPFFSIPGSTGGTLSSQYSLPSVTDVSFQAAVTDLTSPAGFRLTAPAELHVAVQPFLNQVPGPTGDDDFIVINVTQCPTPWAPFGLNHYGVNYTEYYVNSNGKITFGGPDIDFSPTIAEALSGLPFIGTWTDLDPTLGGAITVNALSGGRKQKIAFDVPYFGQPGALNGSNTVFDRNTLEEVVSKLDFMPPGPTSDVFIGISAGALGGATDGGATMFAPGASGAPAAPTDMIYDFGAGQLPPSLLPGTLQCVMFVPVGNSYTWVGL